MVTRDKQLSSATSQLEANRPEPLGSTIDATERSDAIIESSAYLKTDRDTRTRITNVDEAGDAHLDSSDDDSSSLSSALSSSSASSSDDDDQGEEAAGSTLVERQARNIERNARFLGDLHEKYKDQLPVTKLKKGSKTGMSLNDETDPSAQQEDSEDERLMTMNDMWMRNSHRLFQSFPLETRSLSLSATTPLGSTANQSYPQLIHLLNERYPHRHNQIRQLASVLSPTVAMDHRKTASASKNHVYVPAPIFCLGPAGTAKTSIVCDVVEVLQKATYHTSLSSQRATTTSSLLSDNAGSGSSPSVTTGQNDNNARRSIPPAPVDDVRPTTKLQAAYIDCSILEPSSIERLVYAAYQQLRPGGSNTTGSRHASTSGLGRSGKARKKRRGEMADHSTTTVVIRPMVGSNIDGSIVGTPGTATNHQSSDAEGKPTVGAKGSTITTGPEKVRDDEDIRFDNTDSTTRNITTNAGSSRSTSTTLGASTTLSATLIDIGINDGTHHAKTIERRTLPSRGVKRAFPCRKKGQEIGQPTSQASGRPKRKKGYIMGNDNENGDNPEDTVETSHSAVLALGRSLQQYYGPSEKRSTRTGNLAQNPDSGGKRCTEYVGVLILDKAEELMSLSSTVRKRRKSSQGGHSVVSASSTSSATNYLAELLLLPKIMKLNVTVIVISSYSVLDKTRLNNNVAPSKSLATISNGVHPILIQFPAYRGSQVFQEILTTKQNMRLVMGDITADNGVSSMRGNLKEKLVRVFWNTVIQSISDSTRNIYDLIRLGRALWPWFVAPLHPRVIRTTMEGLASKLHLSISDISRLEHTKKVDDEIAYVLGTRFHHYVASISSSEESLTCLHLDEAGLIPTKLIKSFKREVSSDGSRTFNQPYLRTCLLLAAFVCQSNKADQDRKIFSTQASGRRRKNRAKDDIYGGNDEDLAFGTSTPDAAQRGEQLQSLRPRPFPLERVISIFATLVRLNPAVNETPTSVLGGFEGGEDLEALMDSLGSTRLNTDIMHLIDTGYLHPAGFQGTIKAEQISLSTAKFWCSLTKEEAIEISTKLEIPIDKYLI